MSRLDLNGKVVAITGGARGIGRATASELTRRGAVVAIGDIDLRAAQDTARDLALGSAHALDVSDPRSFRMFLDEVEKAHGTLDVLVNNAGVMPIGPYVNEEDSVTRRIVEINLLGVMWGSKEALRRMLPRKSGTIINVSSIAADSFVPGGAAYCASKHAVSGFTESLRREYRASGVQIAQLLPTFTNTELVAGTKSAPGMRNAEPAEIAEGIAGLIEHHRPRLTVTRTAGFMLGVQRYLPSAVTEAMARALGAERVFLDGVDQDARMAYENRARG